MRTLITSLMASAALALSFSAASAADAIDEIPAAPAADYTQPAGSDWSGAYVGGTASWQHGKGKWTSGNTAAGFGGGVYGGYNMQNGQIVYGGEADLGYSGVDATSNGGAREFKQGVNGSIRGRVGYDMDPVLVYGTAGLAATSAKMKDATSSDKNTLLGWTAGAGAETKVTDNITARVEYRYTDYGKKDFNLDSGKFSSGFDEHSVRVGVGVKF
ncbi:outer membrane protein [Ensifer soli]|uniref:outer membrane protein n=1 Tax=Ciceribacter sp. sgz301302 TaxID=3342379 RepID=UPI0035B8CF9A